MISPSPTLVGWYDYRLVALSVFIAILAAYAALDLAGRVTFARGFVRFVWLSGGASAMGLGIWSMHYIGMLAYHLPVRVVYDWPTVLASLLAAIFTSAIALFIVSRQQMGWISVIIGSITMGVGIASMHYIGMEAMRLPAMCSYSMPLVVLSITVAIVISLVALLLTFRFRGETTSWGWRKSISAIIMGAAIPVMHYIGMAAASFTPAPLQPMDMMHSVRISSLGISGITLVTLMVLSIVFITSIVDRRFSDQAQELASSEYRYRRIVETSFDAFIATDAKGTITDWNAQAESTFGWSRAEAIGKPFSDMVPYHGASTEGAQHLAELFTDERTDNVLQRRLEVDAKHKSGHAFPAEITISSLQYGKSRICAAFVHDVTQRKAIELEREQAKEAAEAANRTKSEFLANMSHEIRTPLNGIIGMTELALETELTTEQREYLDTVKLSADSLLLVINDILDFSKVEAGRLELEAIDFDLNDSLENTLKTLVLRADEKGIELLCEVDKDVPEMVRGDYGRLRQVLVNLVGNAIKFTSHGEVLVRVQVLEKLADAYMLQFTVADTGIGIAPEKLQTIFDPFVQADSSTTRKYGGTGLGLSITSGLVEMMGGKIWVESEFGRGSQFYFTIKLHPAELRAATVSASIDSLKGVRVLVVDDNRTNRRILDAVLANWGMLPTSVDGGEAAIIELRAAMESNQPFRLVLTDRHMPNMDGFTMIESIRRERELSTAVIMMLTSGGHRGDAQRCEELNVAAYLLKPIRQSELRAALACTVGTNTTDLKSPLITQATLQNSGDPGAKLSMLLVEDNSVNQLLVKKMLEKRGHAVTVASDGQQAVNILREKSFDLVLMDVQMPVMDGLTATSTLREMEKTTGNHQRVVAMTAFAMTGDKDRCLAAGMDGYLSKPIRAQELDDLLEALIETKMQPSQANLNDSANSNGKGCVDAEELLGRIDGDLALLSELLNIFRTEYPEYLRVARESLAAGELEPLKRVAHTLRGSLANLSAVTASEIAARLENETEQLDLESTGLLVNLLEAEIVKSVAALESIR